MSNPPPEPRASYPSQDAVPFALRLKSHQSQPQVAPEELDPTEAERLRAHARWNELIELLLAQHDAAKTPAERAALLVEVAEVFRDGLADEPQALDALIEAWRTDSSFDPAIAPLEELARAQGRWPEVFRATEELVATERDRDRALALYERMVWWLTAEVPTAELAAHYAERTRVLDPTHSAVHLHQATVFRSHGDGRNELIELDRTALSARRSEDKAKAHVLMALRTNEGRLKNPAETKRHLLAALTVDPTCMAAMRGLAVIYEGERDTPALVDMLERQAEAAREPAERIRVLVHLGELYEKDLLKPEGAAERYQVAFALDPQNENVLAALERCYTSTRAWPELARALEVVTLGDDEGMRRTALKKLAEVQESRMGEPAEALRSYAELQKLAPTDEGTLGNLARLSEKLGDWRAAASWRSKLAESATDGPMSARMHVAAAQLLAARDREPALARIHYEEAVAVDPAHEGAWNALVWDARQAGDYPRLVRYLEQRALSTEAPRLRGELYVQIAGLRAEHLGDDLGAVQAYEAARLADPTNEAAARALLELYVATERWQEADALCQRAALAAERDGDTDRLCWALRHGRRIALALGDQDRALAVAVSCFELRPEDDEVRTDLLESTLANKDKLTGLSKARTAVYALADRAEELTASECAILGECVEAMGNRERAHALYTQAIAADGSDPRALAGVARLLSARGDSVGAAEYAASHARTLDDAEARGKALVRAAASLAAASQLEQAAQVYEEARTLRPADHQLLHALVPIYAKLEKWTELASVLRAVAEGDTDPRRKSKAIFAIAQIARDKVQDLPTAVALFEESLDLDPTHLQAFEQIVRIHTDARGWLALAESYRRMLGRAFGGGDVKLQHALYHQLGLVYRDRVHDMERAVEAFRSAVELVPTSAEDQAILRELLAMRGRVGDAVALALEQARRDPLSPGPYPALFDLLVREGALDRAWCVASIMGHLGVLNEAQAGFLRARPPPQLTAIRGALDARFHLHLLHAELDPVLTAIFETLAPAAIDLRVAQVSLRERLTYPGPNLGGRGTPTAWIGDAAARAAAALGLPAPRLHARQDAGPALGGAATRTPALMVSTAALDALPLPLHAFVFGKHVFGLIPPLLLRAVCPTVTELAAALSAAARIAGPKEVPRSTTDEALRSKLSKGQLDYLASAVAQAIARGLGMADVERWSQRASVSGSRAGLLLVGDVELARAALAREPQLPGDAPLREQMRELVLFALSDALAAARQTLGVAVTA